MLEKDDFKFLDGSKLDISSFKKIGTGEFGAFENLDFLSVFDKNQDYSIDKDEAKSIFNRVVSYANKNFMDKKDSDGKKLDSTEMEMFLYDISAEYPELKQMDKPSLEKLLFDLFGDKNAKLKENSPRLSIIKQLVTDLNLPYEKMFPIIKDTIENSDNNVPIEGIEEILRVAKDKNIEFSVKDFSNIFTLMSDKMKNSAPLSVEEMLIIILNVHELNKPENTAYPDGTNKEITSSDYINLAFLASLFKGNFSDFGQKELKQLTLALHNGEKRLSTEDCLKIMDLLKNHGGDITGKSVSELILKLSYEDNPTEQLIGYLNNADKNGLKLSTENLCMIKNINKSQEQDLIFIEDYSTINTFFNGQPVDTDLHTRLNEISKKISEKCGYEVKIQIDNNAVTEEFAASDKNINPDGTRNVYQTELPKETIDSMDNLLTSMQERGMEIPKNILMTTLGVGYSGGFMDRNYPDTVTLSLKEPAFLLLNTLAHETAHLMDLDSDTKKFTSDKSKVRINNSNYQGGTPAPQRGVGIYNNKHDINIIDIAKLVREYATVNNQEFVAEVTALLANNVIVKNEQGEYIASPDYIYKVKDSDKEIVNYGCYMNITWNDDAKYKLNEMMKLYNEILGDKILIEPSIYTSDKTNSGELFMQKENLEQYYEL